MTKDPVVEQYLAAVREVLDPLGREAMTAEVLAKVAELPYDGDDDAYVQSVAQVARSAFERELVAATARDEEAWARLAAMEVFERFRPSDVVH